MIEGVKKSNPGKPYKELVAIIGQLYAKLDDKKKQGYTDTYLKEKEKYEVQVREYEKKYGKIPRKEKSSPKGPSNTKEEKAIKR